MTDDAPQRRRLSPEEEQELAALFDEVLELPAAEQQAFVLRRTEGRPALRASLVDLLGVDPDASFILDAPIGIVRDVTTLEKVGDVIGRYCLVDRLGEGGMGTVYLAEQVDGVRRRVALKIIKWGMDTASVIRRFHRERQAMASFAHPGIAALLDAGATERGRPYFVLELVEGPRITDYAVDRGLGLAERLELLVQVCRAVAHAHQRGFIHRDLKPSNILVAEVDGRPQPKVIDFGIAKALDDRDGGDARTLITMHSVSLGTPNYMSPEQAASGGRDVDTRSDVFALGVLLYELLTGDTPLGRTRVAEMDTVRLVESLQHLHVVPPSAVVAAPAASGAEPRGVVGPVPKALDWIASKALRVAPDERYASVAELGRDVERFLQGEPVEAAAPSRWYPVRLLLNRHRRAAAAALAVVALLAVATVVSVSMAIDAARANRRLTETQAKLSRNNTELVAARENLLDLNERERLRVCVQLALGRMEAKAFDAMMVAMAELTPTMDALLESGFALPPAVQMDSGAGPTELAEPMQALDGGDLLALIAEGALPSDAAPLAEILDKVLEEWQLRMGGAPFVSGGVPIVSSGVPTELPDETWLGGVPVSAELGAGPGFPPGFDPRELPGGDVRAPGSREEMEAAMTAMSSGFLKRFSDALADRVGADAFLAEVAEALRGEFGAAHARTVSAIRLLSVAAVVRAEVGGAGSERVLRDVGRWIDEFDAVDDAPASRALASSLRKRAAACKTNDPDLRAVEERRDRDR